MKMNARSLSFVMAAALLLLSACSRREEARQWHVSLEVGGSTKAVSVVGGNTLKTYWQVDDPVSVVASPDIVGTLKVDTVDPMDDTRAYLSGNIWGLYVVNDVLNLYYPTIIRDYWGQGGTLSGLSNYAFLTATSTVTAVNGRDLTLSNAVFSHCQAFCHMTFYGPAPSHNLLNLKIVRVYGLNNRIVRRVPSSGAPTYGEIRIEFPAPYNSTGEVYFAIHDDFGGVESYTIEVTDGGDHVYTTNIYHHFVDGHYYETTINF